MGSRAHSLTVYNVNDIVESVVHKTKNSYNITPRVTMDTRLDVELIEALQ